MLDLVLLVLGINGGDDATNGKEEEKDEKAPDVFGATPDGEKKKG